MNANTLTVFCDMGDVLVNSRALIRASTEVAAIRCSQEGFVVDPSLFLMTYLELDRGTKRPHLNHLFGDRRIASATFEKIQRSTDLRSIGAFLTYYRKHLRTLLKPDKEVSDFYSSLSKLDNIKRGIISDGTTDDQLELLTRLEIINFFTPNLILISEDIGSEKVNSNIFLEGVRRSATEPARTFMVGDNLERDIRIPQSLGWRTIFFTKYRIDDFLYKLRAEPDFVCSDFNEVLKVLLGTR